jgi:uncharacterized protein YrzB (UPF0473 family)
MMDPNDTRFMLIENNSDYKLYSYYTSFRNHRTGIYYKIEGKTEDVLNKIKQIKLSYPPEGYMTRFDLVKSFDKKQLVKDYVVYTGYHSNSCD